MKQPWLLGWVVFFGCLTSASGCLLTSERGKPVDRSAPTSEFAPASYAETFPLSFTLRDGRPHAVDVAVNGSFSILNNSDAWKRAVSKARIVRRSRLWKLYAANTAIRQEFYGEEPPPGVSISRPSEVAPVSSADRTAFLGGSFSFNVAMMALKRAGTAIDLDSGAELAAEVVASREWTVLSLESWPDFWGSVEGKFHITDWIHGGRED